MASQDFDDFDVEKVSWSDLMLQFTVATQRMTGRVRQQSGKLSNEVKKNSTKFRKMARTKVLQNRQVERVTENVRNQIRRIDKTFSSQLVVSRTEKVWYAASLVFIFLLGYCVASHPEWVHIVYTTSVGVLLPIRFYSYVKKGYHFYLADLCYFVNLLSLLYIWVWPTWVHLWVACYAFSFGTLSFAIITWRNSLVLHSVDKTTSTAIHIFPPLVFHTINHLLPPDFQRARFPAVERAQAWDMVQSLSYTTIAYFTWQSLYHYFITWRQKDKIEAGQVTSFEFLRKAYRNTLLGRFVNGLPGPLPVLAFTFIQFGYQISTMMLCPIWYSSRTLSSCFMIFLFFSAAYNGATYYIDVFGERFHKELKHLQKELDKLTAEAASADNSAASSSTNLQALGEEAYQSSPEFRPVSTESSPEFRPMEMSPELPPQQPLLSPELNAMRYSLNSPELGHATYNTLKSRSGVAPPLPDLPEIAELSSQAPSRDVGSDINVGPVEGTILKRER